MVNLCSRFRQYISYRTAVDVDHEESNSAGLVGYRAMDVDHKNSDDHEDSDSIGLVGYPKGSESVGYRGHLRYLHLIFARATPDQKTDPQQNSGILYPDPVAFCCATILCCAIQ